MPTFAPHRPKTLNQFGWRFKYIITSAQGVNVKHLVEIDSAVMNLRMRKNAVFVKIFSVVNILPIYLSIYLHGTVTCLF